MVHMHIYMLNRLHTVRRFFTHFCRLTRSDAAPHSICMHLYMYECLEPCLLCRVFLACTRNEEYECPSLYVLCMMRARLSAMFTQHAPGLARPWGSDPRFAPLLLLRCALLCFALPACGCAAPCAAVLCAAVPACVCFCVAASPASAAAVAAGSCGSLGPAWAGRDASL